MIGSQAILGQYPNAPDSLLVSIEADVYPRYAPERSDLVDGAIGELSQFHQTFGYYAHGVDQTTAMLPAGWMDRLIRVENENTGGAIGWCLEAHDLAAAKLAAGRDQDLRFVQVLLSERLVSADVLLERTSTLPLPVDQIPVVHARAARIVAT
ncbi:MAG: hypothetical protein O3A25_16090 [Acidobacteria bacterium]|nr:hypothetical protein [Acidobacteriota bacterium]